MDILLRLSRPIMSSKQGVNSQTTHLHLTLLHFIVLNTFDFILVVHSSIPLSLVIVIIFTSFISIFFHFELYNTKRDNSV